MAGGMADVSAAGAGTVADGAAAFNDFFSFEATRESAAAEPEDAGGASFRAPHDGGTGGAAGGRYPAPGYVNDPWFGGMYPGGYVNAPWFGEGKFLCGG